MMLNNSYNKQYTTNAYNSNTVSNNQNVLNPIHITSSPIYKINISNINSYPNLCYVADVVTNIYLPDLSSAYNYFSFTIINPLIDMIYLHSSNQYLIYSTISNSVLGDTSMAIEGKRTVKVNFNKTFWNVFIN
jgi:hypothetical protein